jgi:putative DNA primase/helicase
LKKKWQDAAAKPDSSEGFLEPIEPWPYPLVGPELLSDIEIAVERYVVLPGKAAAASALWTLFAHAHEAAENSPILAQQSPEKRCGKTTALAVLSYLVPRAVPAANVSPAALYRSVELFGPTLLIDEGDSFLGSDNDKMRGLLNSGFTRATAFVLRCVGEDSIPTPFRTWCPKVIALIGQLPDTLQDRSIVITLRRKLANEHVERFNRRHHEQLRELRAKAARFANDHLEGLRAADPKMPAELNDRAQDAWRPLLAIADAAGGIWPEKARHAAVSLSGKAEGEDDTSSGVMLLKHCYEAFQKLKLERLPSTNLVENLNNNELWPWSDWRRGKGISARGVARMLGRFGIEPRKNTLPQRVPLHRLRRCLAALSPRAKFHKFHGNQ